MHSNQNSLGVLSTLRLPSQNELTPFFPRKQDQLKRLGRDRKINGKKGEKTKKIRGKNWPLVCGAQMRSHRKSKTWLLLSRKWLVVQFLSIQFLKNENFNSCEEYIRVVCTRRPPVVLVWCFRFPALWWNIAVTLIIEKEDHQILSISLSESFDDLGVISSLSFFRQSFVNFIKCYSREWTSADMSNYYVFVTFMNRPHPSSFW